MCAFVTLNKKITYLLTYLVLWLGLECRIAAGGYSRVCIMSYKRKLLMMGFGEGLCPLPRVKI